MGWFWRIGLLRSRIKDSSRAVVAGRRELLHVLYYTKTEALRKGVGTSGDGLLGEFRNSSTLRIFAHALLRCVMFFHNCNSAYQCSSKAPRQCMRNDQDPF